MFVLHLSEAEVNVAKVALYPAPRADVPFSAKAAEPGDAFESKRRRRRLLEVDGYELHL
jgi:hypothetical protein